MKFSARVSAATESTARSRLNVEVVKESRLSRTQLVRTRRGTQLNKQYAKQLLASGVVKYIEPNYLLSIGETPNDTRYSELWGMENSAQTGGLANIDIDAPEAWSLSTGSSSVVVGVVDTGVDYTHPDLAENIWVNDGEIPNNFRDDDGNGVIDDVHGFNAITGGGDPRDDHSHGTHCAGIIGAVGNNSLGVTGVNWRVEIMALKFLNASGMGTTQDAIDAIEYAVLMKRRGVNLRVLNASWGGGGYSQALADAISAANNAGILFVAAAGNAGGNNDAVATYPANFDIANVVSVAAVDHNGNLATFSNYGATTVDLAAPGVGILSTTRNGTYASLSGTSMAAPHISGVAALVLGREQGLTVHELKNRLLNTVRPLPTLRGLVLKGGMVNAFNALTNRLTPTPRSDPTLTYSKATLPIAYDSPLGTRVLNVDDGYAEVDLGFLFPYYRESFPRLAISSNGRVLPLRAGERAPQEPDYSNRLVAGINPYHDDLVPSPLSSDRGVWFKSNGETATVTWVAVTYARRFSNSPDSEIRVQAKLSADGRIEFHYEDVSTGDPSYEYGASASIGLVPPVGSLGSMLVITNNSPAPSLVDSQSALTMELGAPIPRSDFDGDGRSDFVLWNPKSGSWHILRSGSGFDPSQLQRYELGLSGDLPLIGDFDGDSQSDIAVWRPGNGSWYFRLSTENYATISEVQWGLPGDRPLTGDVDGDLRADLIVYRDKRREFLVLLSRGGFNRTLALTGRPDVGRVIRQGGIGFDPVVGDFNGDGKIDFSVVWQPIRYWIVRDNEGRLLYGRRWGLPGDTPLSCDYDGDRVDDRVVVRATLSGGLEWHVKTSHGLTVMNEFGVLGDIPQCNRDYDGDGHGDSSVFRPSDGEWYYRSSENGNIYRFSFGLSGDVPL